MEQTLPPLPYACVRLAGSHARGWYDDRFVPLGWLLDWRDALKLPAYVGDVKPLTKTKQPDTAREPIFSCFYAPGPAYRKQLRPPANCRSLRQMRNWPDVRQSNNTIEPRESCTETNGAATAAALYNVRVISLHLSKTEPFAHVPHVIVRLPNDPTFDFTVPLSWMRNCDELRIATKNDQQLNAKAIWQCYFDPNGMRRYPAQYTSIEMQNGYWGFRKWHPVNVVRICNGEFVFYVGHF